MPKLKIKFSDKEVVSMKEMVEDIEVDDDEFELLKKESRRMLLDSLCLAKVFLKSYNYLLINQSVFKNDENDYTEKIKNYLKGFDVEPLRDMVEEYGHGQDFGSYYLRERIRDKVNKCREDMVGLVLLFFRLFGGDE